MEGAPKTPLYSAHICTYYTAAVLIHGCISNEDAHARGLPGALIELLTRGYNTLFFQVSQGQSYLAPYKARRVWGEAAGSCPHRTVGKVPYMRSRASFQCPPGQAPSFPGS